MKIYIDEEMYNKLRELEDVNLTEMIDYDEQWHKHYERKDLRIFGLGDEPYPARTPLYLFDFAVDIDINVTEDHWTAEHGRFKASFREYYWSPNLWSTFPDAAAWLINKGIDVPTSVQIG